MGRRNKKHAQNDSDIPSLLERTFAAGCTRLAVVSLHKGAGARTALESLVSEFGRRGVPTGVTRAPRLALETDGIDEGATEIQLPEGVFVATADELARTCDVLESIESLGCTSSLGEVGIYRVLKAGPVPVYGPDDTAALGNVLGRLEQLSGGLALLDGAWERRDFAAPGVTQGVVLAVGPAYSGTPERSAAAVRFVADLLELPTADPAATHAWRIAAEEQKALLIDAKGQALGAPLPTDEDPSEAAELYGDAVHAAVLPDKLHDHFLAPLTRGAQVFDLIVRDATRVRLAPVYLKSWTKKGGQIRVLEPMRLLSVATNPYNTTGPDADPMHFRGLVAEQLPEIPVHDVRLEAASSRRSLWKLWA